MANSFTPQEIEEFLQEFFDVVGARQYIGARYVPVFGHGRDTPVDWDDSEPYEPLSIVYWQGDSYTSRQYVPAGIPIDNESYWVATGRYNAQVEQYRQEVLRVRHEMTALGTALPMTDFDATHTVRDYVDESVAGATQGLDETYVPWPDAGQYGRYGTAGQILKTLGDGGTQWIDQQLPSEDLMRQAVDDWLDDNPMAGAFIETIEDIITFNNYQTALPDLNGVTGAVCYRLIFDANTTDIPANLPFSTWPDGIHDTNDNRVPALLVCTANADGTAARVQMLTTYGNSYVRCYVGGSWRPWNPVVSPLTLLKRSSQYDVMQAYLPNVGYADYSTVIPDFDTAPINTKIQLVRLGSDPSGDWPAHGPAEYVALSGIVVSVLETYAQDSTYVGGFQTLRNKYGYWVRNYQLGVWQPWVNIAATSDTVYHREGTDYDVTQTRMPTVSYANYQTTLPDFDTAPINRRYRIVRLAQADPSGDWPAHAPTDYAAINDVCTSVLETYAESANYAGGYQVLTNTHGQWVRNFKGGEWQPWSNLTTSGNHRNVIVVGSGGTHYSFSAAILDAYAMGDCDVYVNKGTYDVKAEMEALFGSDFWTNFTEQTQWSYGLPWGNGMRIIGSPGARIKADLSQVANTDAWAYFSVLMNYNTQAHDQKINEVYGLTFDCTCIRYCIHLDQGAVEMDDTYTIDTCDLYLDNSDNTTKTFAYCVGMGASINTIYNIRNCHVHGVPPANPRDTAWIYFHHTNASDPHDMAVFENNYLEGLGTIRVDAYGESTNECLVQICGNSVGSALYLPASPQSNLKVLAWNNEVRP